MSRLALYPDLVIAGEYWRIITFLSLPLNVNPIWVLFTLWFIYFILDSIEKEWGEFKTTLYVLVSIVLTIFMSFVLNYPILQVSDFESTLFLAAATLFPEFEIRLYFVIPVKMKWLGWISLAFLSVRFVGADLFGRIYLLAIYSNFLLFFGPRALARVRQFIRKEKYKRDSRR